MTSQEIITKFLIQNEGNFKLYASGFSLITCKGLSFEYKENSELRSRKIGNYQ